MQILKIFKCNSIKSKIQKSSRYKENQKKRYISRFKVIEIQNKQNKGKRQRFQLLVSLSSSLHLNSKYEIMIT